MGFMKTETINKLSELTFTKILARGKNKHLKATIYIEANSITYDLFHNGVLVLCTSSSELAKKEFNLY